jgi:cyclophilin family peptidyl-prolyl cis-trans isomerase
MASPSRIRFLLGLLPAGAILHQKLKARAMTSDPSHPHSRRPARFATGGVFLAALCLAGGCGPAESAKPPPPKPGVAVIETDHGTIAFELLAAAAPKTVENFRLLATRGYYNGLTFHRILKGVMIQGGDPQGDGQGGESAWGGKFDDEIERTSPLYDRGAGYKRGIVAMANSGPNTNASQFFIVHRDYPMPPNYTIFGRVVRGIETVDALAELPTQRGADGRPSRPVTPPVMRRVFLEP